jgi:glycosyltransferase involved in cell wall biosynthesis
MVNPARSPLDQVSPSTVLPLEEGVEVSVIIPTYQREMLVVEAIESALRQQGVSLEVLVLDDSPTGSAAKDVGAIGDSRVRYFKRAVPSGGRPALVRNDGSRLARGRFLHFLDDDDILEEGSLAALTDALARRPSAGMAFGAVEPFGGDAASLEAEQEYFRNATRSARTLVHRMHLAAHLLFCRTVLVNSACMARREAFEIAGGYDPEVPVNEDVELWLRVVRGSGFTFVDRPVVRYRTGAPSLMRETLAKKDAGRDKFRAAYARMHEKYRQQYGRPEFYALKVLARAILDRT